MVKALEKVGLKGTYLNIIKTTYGLLVGHMVNG